MDSTTKTSLSYPQKKAGTTERTKLGKRKGKKERPQRCQVNKW